LSASMTGKVGRLGGIGISPEVAALALVYL
jgi:hypothetical protein